MIWLCFASQWVSGVHHSPTATAFRLSLCSILFLFLGISLRYCHLCHSKWDIFNWDANKQSSEAHREAGISRGSEGRSAKNCEEDAKPAGAGRVAMAREEQEREKKRRACHLSLQDSCKVLIMCVLFIPCLCSLTISWETFQRKGGEEETKSLLLDWGMQTPPLLPAPSFLCCCSWGVSLEALT